MSNQRRRAHDFTDSLSSFHLTVSKGKSLLRASSENRLHDMRDKQGENEEHSYSRNKSRDSVILAGNLTSQRCTSLSDLCNTAQKSYHTTHDNKQPLQVSGEASYLSDKPDLNKCINLFHNEHLNTEYDTLEEQLNTTLSETAISENIDICHLSTIQQAVKQVPKKNMAMKQQNLYKRRRSMSTDLLENTVSLNQDLTRSKSYTTFNRILNRDTNHNIKANQLSSEIAISSSEDVETTIPSFNALKLSKLSVLPRRKDSYLEDKTYDSTSGEASSKEELDPLKLRRFLYSLADEKPLTEAAVQQRLLRRLSANCYDSPKGFTEGLLTIIEESFINDSLQYPEVSLYRFNEQLRRMCKFIEDETIPEWPRSPGKPTPTSARRKSHNLSWKSLSYGTPNNEHFTPVSPRRYIKSPKKIYRRKSKNTPTKNLLHDSTNIFENLEAYCEKLYPGECKTFSSLEEQSQSSLRSMEDIRRACESQMASLEESFNIHEEIKKAGTYTSANQHDRTESRTVSDTIKQQRRSTRREMLELESTFMYEIARERQRCLETAKIMESDRNLESTETIISEDTYPNIVISKSLPTMNDDKFKKILMCVKNYQDYLEQRKPVLNFLRARLSGPRTPRDKKDDRTNKISNEDLGACAPILLQDKLLRTPKHLPGKKSISPSSAKYRPSKTVVSKPRLFVTPGRTPVKSYKPKRQYFPKMPDLKQDDLMSKPKPGINPTMRKIFDNYGHVVSPVGQYIRGKESLNLKKTSEKKETTPSPRMKSLRQQKQD